MKAYELLDSPEKFTTQIAARDANGECVPAQDPAAVCWCTVGAIIKCYPQPSDFRPTMNKLIENIGRSIGPWSDEVGYEKAVAKLKELDI